MQHILLTVSGVTPQAIVAGLINVFKEKGEYPCLIEVITTQMEKTSIERNFLGEDSSLAKLCKAHGLPAIQCENIKITVPLDKNSHPIKHIRKEDAQEFMTGFIAHRVRELCTSQELSVHALPVGRYNILGYVLGYVVYLFGRTQDSIYHVQNSDGQECKFLDHNSYDHSAMIGNGNAELPKVDISRQPENKTSLNNQTQDSNVKYNKMQEAAYVKLDFERMSVCCGGVEVSLSPDCFAFYSWFAQDCMANGQEGIDPPRSGARVAELDGRMKKYLSAAIHPSKIPSNITDLQQLLELADDEVVRVHGKGSLLKPSKNTDYLVQNNERKEEDSILLRTKQANLWSRLLRDTNEALNKELGYGLAQYYQIKTVEREVIIPVIDVKNESQEQGRYPRQPRNQRNACQFKGLNVQPDNIYIIPLVR